MGAHGRSVLTASRDSVVIAFTRHKRAEQMRIVCILLVT